ncbi:MAG: sugar phosphate isomerase/epimerase family protein [Eubacteriales bacterium]|nr:sugar phosphate isomerase/epimerase family protein [Eubacteriales bacterium]
MKIGVRGHDYGKHSAEKFARILREEGYETVQLAIPRAIEGAESFADVTEELVDRIRSAFEKEQLEIGVFSCYMDLSSPDDEVRGRAVETFCRCLSLARQAGARMVGSETSYECLSRREKARRFPLLLDSLKRMTEEAERVGMTIGLEPVQDHTLESMDAAAEVLDILGSDRVRLIFDPVNLLRRPLEVNQEEYWRRCLELGGDRIAAVHMKDFVPGEDGRQLACPLGEGVMEYRLIREWMKGRTDLPVMRDELDLAFAEKDMAYLRWMKAVTK